MTNSTTKSAVYYTENSRGTATATDVRIGPSALVLALKFQGKPTGPKNMESKCSTTWPVVGGMRC